MKNLLIILSLAYTYIVPNILQYQSHMFFALKQKLSYV